MKFQKNVVATVLCLALAIFASACSGKSDADITKEVEGRIKSKNPAVTVSSVKDGVVTLGGTVTTQVERDQAEAAAKGEGVKSVVNNIQIKPMAMPTPAMPATTGGNPTITNPVTTMSPGTRPGTTTAPAANAARR